MAPTRYCRALHIITPNHQETDIGPGYDASATLSVVKKRAVEDSDVWFGSDRSDLPTGRTDNNL
jgi:hypothetical protein